MIQSPFHHSELTNVAARPQILLLTAIFVLIGCDDIAKCFLHLLRRLYVLELQLGDLEWRVASLLDDVGRERRAQNLRGFILDLGATLLENVIDKVALRLAFSDDHRQCVVSDSSVGPGHRRGSARSTGGPIHP